MTAFLWLLHGLASHFFAHQFRSVPFRLPMLQGRSTIFHQGTILTPQPRISTAPAQHHSPNVTRAMNEFSVKRAGLHFATIWKCFVLPLLGVEYTKPISKVGNASLRCGIGRATLHIAMMDILSFGSFGQMVQPYHHYLWILISAPSNEWILAADSSCKLDSNIRNDFLVAYTSLLSVAAVYLS